MPALFISAQTMTVNQAYTCIMLIIRKLDDILINIFYEMSAIKYLRLWKQIYTFALVFTRKTQLLININMMTNSLHKPFILLMLIWGGG